MDRASTRHVNVWRMQMQMYVRRVAGGLSKQTVVNHGALAVAGAIIARFTSNRGAHAISVGTGVVRCFIDKIRIRCGDGGSGAVAEIIGPAEVRGVSITLPSPTYGECFSST